MFFTKISSIIVAVVLVVGFLSVRDGAGESINLVGRSQAFLLSVSKANDLQYFGGAKLNDAERPICWYSPDGNEHYRSARDLGCQRDCSLFVFFDAYAAGYQQF